MKIKSIVVAIAVLFCNSILAQLSTDIDGTKYHLDFGGSFGAFFPYSKTNGLNSTVGSNAITYLQLNFKKHYFARLKLGQTTVDYKSIQNYSSLTTNVDAKINSTNIGLDLGYQKRWNHFQPYGFLGIGVSFFEKPDVTYSNSNNMVNFKTGSETQIYLNAGVGLNYIISRNFIIFGELQTITIPNIPTGSLTHLSGISPLLGIKALL